MKSRRDVYQRKKKRGRRKTKWFFGLILIIAGLYWAQSEWLPNREHVDPEWLGRVDKPIFADGQLLSGTGIGSGDSLKLPLPVIQQIIDPTIRYEEDTKSVILTTPQKLVLLKADEKIAKINNKPKELRFAPEEKDGVLYLPAHLLHDLYGAEVQEDAASGVVLLYRAGEKIFPAVVDSGSGKKDSTVPLRTGPSIHQPILADMPEETALRILETPDDKWYYVQLNNGYTGYVQRKDVVLGEEHAIPELKLELSAAKQKWQSKTVNMTWEAVYQVAPKPSSIGKLPGINVVSPTWFSMVDGKGNVKSKADPAYVKWAHGQGMQVWGLFNNSFDPDLTSEALASFENRLTTILQMLHYAKLYDLDGINIDYENVYTKDGENLTQFMRELRPLAEEQGLIVSIDVTPKSNSEMWSAFLDRRALAEVVDYLVLMAYDEHWAASPVAGSVASLPWVRSSVTRILEEDDVPPSKLILGIPLYTRVWTETVKDGKTEVNSKAIGMDKAQQIIAEKKLKPRFSEDTEQNYVEYKDKEGLHRIWLEDAESLKRRVELAKSMKLAGIATWTRTFASDEAWETLREIVK
ncbi:glycosyl hydrolase family 18 protein [Paenibacillus barengoltzii]|uniref:glycosyl hydrolase family 18 protein n=1 Tax=Paenibacillus barengoltzii TaxID=343517 RepID=UPI002DB9F1C2|nr:glycosyl hydrolase family 18 protein [Paenibacillus barengoltzii]MEC2344611.1 glycosyl hydrolase family 18 protein [Paenibacillus barengoltzii]